MEDTNVTPIVPDNLRKRRSYKNPSNYNFSCECGRNFSHKKHYSAHRRRVHSDPKSTPDKSEKKLRCPLCDFYAKFRNEAIKHYEDFHKISFVEEKYRFASHAEFLSWKRKMEFDTKSKYVCTDGSRTYSKHKSTNYHCHRSGYYITRGKGLRSLKTQGSVKMNSYCPSTITEKCLNDDGTCTISFVATHVGHKDELEHLTLTPAEREGLAHKIAMNIPFDEILDQVRNSADYYPVQRLHLVTRKDLYNIESEFKLQSKAVKRKDDTIHLDTWYEIVEDDESIEIEENKYSLEIAESANDKSCEPAVSESTNKPFCQDLNKRKEKFQNALLETLDTISNIEEMEVLENIFAQAGPAIAAIRNRTLPAFIDP